MTMILTALECVSPPALKLDVLFGNLTEMVEFQVEFLKTLEDGTRLVPDLEKLERVDQFKVPPEINTLDVRSSFRWLPVR